MLPRKESTPSQNGEPESCKTSQLCARICIQVPMLDVHAPIHMTRKSRYWNALKTLVSNRGFRSGERTFALDQMQNVSVAVTEEHQTVPLVGERFGEKLNVPVA
jgi:hypothetical protein